MSTLWALEVRNIMKSRTIVRTASARVQNCQRLPWLTMWTGAEISKVLKESSELLLRQVHRGPYNSLMDMMARQVNGSQIPFG